MVLTILPEHLSTGIGLMPEFPKKSLFQMFGEITEHVLTLSHTEQAHADKLKMTDILHVDFFA
jgi:hypothetical protein